MNVQNVLVIHKMGYNITEKKSLEKVLAILKRKKILFRCVSRLEVGSGMLKGREIIIVVGGDGTFLKVAQYIKDNTPVICINADMHNTEGFYSNTNPTNFQEKLAQIINNKIKPKKLWRLIAKIDGQDIEPCLNEYYIGQLKPYDVAKYLLIIDGKAELQKSSGVLAGTASGSTAWCRGAGGKILKKEDTRFQFVVREPYAGKLIKTKIKKAILNRKEKIIIIPKSDDMIIVADALGKEHPLKKNEKVEITQYYKPILLYY